MLPYVQLKYPLWKNKKGLEGCIACFRVICTTLLDFKEFNRLIMMQKL